jgi:NitT/TauT family transport system ATP-binding protein
VLESRTRRRACREVRARAADHLDPIESAETALLEVVHLQKTYASGRRQTVAVADLHFTVQQNEFISIVGPSGCGKTTMLRCVSGLLPASSGQVLLKGQPVTRPPREMVLVFQDYSRSLCPWRSVQGNVTFALEASTLPSVERERRVSEALQVVGLADFREHYPFELSGGMQQRLQIARALAYQPEILLMDEPFGSLDALTRAELEDQLLAIWTANPRTVVFVTHDIEEAVYLSDRVLLLSARPSSVVEELAIDLPRPRDQVETRSLERFAEYRNHIYRRITRESRPQSPVATGA